MSDHDMHDQQPLGSGQPTGDSGSDAGHGWRPPSGPAQPASDSPAGSGDGGSDPTAGAATPSAGQVSGGSAGHVGGSQPSDETTTPRPHDGATWALTYGQPAGAANAQTSGGAPGAAPTSAAPTTAAPSSGAAPGAWAPGNQPGGGYQPGSYQPGGYQPGTYPVGGYPTAQYQQPGYHPGNEPSTGAGYPGAGYSMYQQPVPGQGGRRRVGPKVAAAIVGVALALGGGVAGAAWMHQIDGNTVTTASTTEGGSAPDNAPIIDRSSLASIAAAVRPSVVSIATSNATGSGVVLSADGYILTNNHVAATANGGSVDITLSDGSTVKGKLIGTDAKTDLAVYQAQNLSKPLTPAKFGDSSALRVGDTVLAIGSPLGLQGSVTAGIVSALNRTIDESDNQPQNPFGQQQNSTPSATIAGAIQTDAAINPGNSGGALVNTNGQVVGINTAIATNGSDGNIGVGFAIPSNRAKTVAEDLIKGVAVQHPFLGISVGTASGNVGAQVQQVQSGSPAASAGLQTGDVITAYNGKAVHTSDDLVNDVQAGNVHDQVTLTVTRGGSSMQIKVTLGESK